MKSAVLLFALLLTASFGGHAEPLARPDLAGQVLDASGAAVPNIQVMILAAGPRRGNSPLCPSNYPDCGKRVFTDPQGNFRLSSLDPSLDFCIAALAPGHAPAIQSKILPEAGSVKLILRANDSSSAPPERRITGRMIGPDGAPVAGALIDVEGVENKNSTRWGGNDVTDGMTVSDGDGEFHLGGRKDFTALQTRVSAAGLAPRWARLEPGKTALLRLRPGVTVRGRLVKDGQAVTGVELGLCTEERQSGKYFNGMQAVSGEDGRFVFRNVPAGLKFQVFGKMDPLRSRGMACQREFVSAEDGGTSELGDWQMVPAYRLAGRMLLSDGKPIPANTRLMISREAAWDNVLVPVDRQGGFDVAGIPAERFELHISVPGYHLSPRNSNLELSSHRSLVGRVVGDTPDLSILLEPGKERNGTTSIRLPTKNFSVSPSCLCVE